MANNKPLMEMWCELFIAWLNVNGAICKNETDPASAFAVDVRFIYCGRHYKFAIYDCSNNIPLVVGRRLELDVSYGLEWLKINLNLTDVEIHNPSFNPGVFFEPVKQRLNHEF